MNGTKHKVTVHEFDGLFERLSRELPPDIPYLKSIGNYVEAGDTRLTRLSFHAAPASLWLWNFLLSEDERLASALKSGKKLVGTMKDLGTVPVMAYSFPNLIAFYPDGAWWIPCIMEANASALRSAEALGINESLCPVRAMVGAIAAESDFPVPDLMICGVGATCDDFSALAQFVNGLGHAIHWWELPHRRPPDPGEKAITLPGGCVAPENLVKFVCEELTVIRKVLENHAGAELTDAMLCEGIATANRARAVLAEIRHAVFSSPHRLLPAIELLITEMLIIHFCSDRHECIRVLEAVLKSLNKPENFDPAEARARIFWVNPPADIKAMNILENCGFQLCGTDFMFQHALDQIPTGIPPLEALARCVLADPMIGPTGDRANRIAKECRKYNADAVIVSRIPGASHCAFEGSIIRDKIAEMLDIPVLELEIPAVCDSYEQSIRSRLEALAETIEARR